MKFTTFHYIPYRSQPENSDSEMRATLLFKSRHYLNSGLRTPHKYCGLFNHEIIPKRPGSQVVILGSAYPPSPNTPPFLASFHGLGLNHDVLVYPQRFAQIYTKFSVISKTPNTPIPIHLASAFGGMRGGFIHPSNPIGLGYYLPRRCSALQLLGLPSLEDPNQPFQRADFHDKDTSDLPLPCHMGIVPRSLAGDSPWNCHPRMHSSRIFSLGDSFMLHNLSSTNREIEGKLPNQRVIAQIDSPLGKFETSLHLRDLSLCPENNEYHVVWSAEVPYYPQEISNKLVSFQWSDTVA